MGSASNPAPRLAPEINRAADHTEDESGVPVGFFLKSFSIFYAVMEELELCFASKVD
jgi:hypothetical protein